MVEWEYKEYQPEGLETFEANMGTHYQLYINKVGECRYSLRWIHRGKTNFKINFDAMNWDEAKTFAIDLVKDRFNRRVDFFSERLAHWQKLITGFNNWAGED